MSAVTESNTTAPTFTHDPEHHGIEVGAIFVTSWGWEQTNIDFYQVIRVTPKSVIVQRIMSRMVREVGWAMREVEAIPDSLYGKPFRRKVTIVRVTDPEGTPYIGITSYKVAGLWDGKPCTATYYA